MAPGRLVSCTRAVCGVEARGAGEDGSTPLTVVEALRPFERDTHRAMEGTASGQQHPTSR